MWMGEIVGDFLENMQFWSPSSSAALRLFSSLINTSSLLKMDSKKVYLVGGWTMAE